MVMTVCRQFLFQALLVAPLGATAGVSYEMAVRPLDQTFELGAPPQNPVVTRYLVDAGQVRVTDSRAKTVYVFKDQSMFVIDNTARSVHWLKHATLAQVSAHYTQSVQQLRNAAAMASPQERPEAQRKAEDMARVSDRMRQAIAREFRVTVRFESVDGHACRIWEEHEGDAKRLELCVAPTATLAEGAEILRGLKTLSQFREGSDFALGVELGLSDWWSDIDLLGGVPLLIREYKYESPVREIMLSAIRKVASSADQFAPPQDYRLEEGPDYTLWYVR